MAGLCMPEALTRYKYDARFTLKKEGEKNVLFGALKRSGTQIASVPCRSWAFATSSTTDMKSLNRPDLSSTSVSVHESTSERDKGRDHELECRRAGECEREHGHQEWLSSI